MSSMPDTTGVIDAIKGRSLPASANIATLVGMALGLVGFGYGMFVSDGGAAWAWGAFLVALIYILGVAQGGVMLAVILTGTWGRWGRPLKRIGESFGLFLPIAWLFLVGFTVLGAGIYPWNPNTILPGGPVDLAPHSLEAIASKEIWLNHGFFIARQALGVGLLIVLDLIYIRASLRPDLVAAKARLGSDAPGWWGSIIGGATDVDKTLEEGLKLQALLVPFLGFGYAMIFSMIAFDLVMSLSPWWYSNMFGGWFFASSVWIGLAMTGLVAMLAKDWLGISDFVKPNVTHDLGKLLLAFTMFWAYTAFAQLLPIWYTDMPEETDFLLVRLMLPQWSWLARTVAIMCFLAPFTILLSRGIKKMRWPFAAICVLIMVGVFMERTLLVMPSVYFGDTFPVIDFLLCNVLVWIGMLSFFGQVVGRALAALPGIGVTDPYMEPHPWDVHVHSLDASHH